MTRSRPARRWPWRLGAALALAVGLLVALAPSPDEALRRQFEAVLSERLGTPVTIAGLDLDALVSRPELRLRGLRVGAPERPELTVGELVVVSASPAAALSGEVEALVVREARLHLRRRSDGGMDFWGTLPSGGGGELGRLALPSLRVEASSIAIDGTSGLAAELMLRELTLGALVPGRASDLRLDLALRMDEPLGFQGQFVGDARVLLDAAHGVPRLAALGVDFQAGSPSWRVSHGRLDLDELALRPEGGVGLAGARASGVIGSDSGRSAALALWLPSAALHPTHAELPAFSAVLEWHASGKVLRASLGLLDSILTRTGVSAGFSRLELESPGSGRALALGPLVVEDDFRQLRAVQLAFELSIPKPGAAQGRLGLSGRVDIAASREPLSSGFGFTGELDGAPLEFSGDLLEARTPALRLVAQLAELDLDRYLGGESAGEGGLADWRSLPLALDLRVGRMRQRGLELRDVQLSYRPGAKPR